MMTSRHSELRKELTGKKAVPISVTWLIVIFVMAGIVAGFVAAAVKAHNRIREIEWLAGVPSADSGAATNGPARYSGRLFGPEDRRTPLGQNASAYWWRVTSEGGGEDSKELINCSEIARSGLALVTPGGSVPIAWSGADPDEVSLASDSDDGEYGLPFFIDIGDAPTMVYDTVPPGACRGEKYIQLHIGQGIKADAIGCLRNGVIERCDSSIGGVLAVPDIKSDLRHRVRAAMHAFFIPMYIGIWLLFPSTMLLWFWSRRRVRKALQGGYTGSAQ